MLEIALIEPKIPPNTGNIARLCAATDTLLHLVRPLGFQMTDRHLKRAGLDYWEWVPLAIHNSLDDFLQEKSGSRLHFFSKKAGPSYLQAAYQENDCLVFGNEVSGLPERLFSRYSTQFYRIPTSNPNVRSLNLASAVSIVTFEALRQLGRLDAESDTSSIGSP